jgi:hypothetical protein
MCWFYCFYFYLKRDLTIVFMVLFYNVGWYLSEYREWIDKKYSKNKEG